MIHSQNEKDTWWLPWRDRFSFLQPQSYYYGFKCPDRKVSWFGTLCPEFDDRSICDFIDSLTGLFRTVCLLIWRPLMLFGVWLGLLTRVYTCWSWNPVINGEARGGCTRILGCIEIQLDVYGIVDLGRRRTHFLATSVSRKRSVRKQGRKLHLPRSELVSTFLAFEFHNKFCEMRLKHSTQS